MARKINYKIIKAEMIGFYSFAFLFLIVFLYGLIIKINFMFLIIPIIGWSISILLAEINRRQLKNKGDK